MSIAARRSVPALLQVDAILGRLTGTEARSEVCRYLRGEFPHFDWVGIYRCEGSELVLDGWDGSGPTEHLRIPVTEGLCGRAVRDNRTVRVDDVSTDPSYLACFLSTRSEIVVPIREEGEAIGEIDVDGRTVAAFDASDEVFLAEVARRLVATFRTGPPPSAAPAGSLPVLP
ncbi:MAG: GAF domain-containing protein [Thermoplasmata archaeon]